jgi:hypothetical protein
VSMWLVPTLGVLAGLVSVADTVPYVRDTLGGATRPHRGSWLVWTVLAVVVSCSQWADGASWSVLLAVSQSVAVGLVFVLALRHGVGGTTPVELTVMALAGLGVAGWVVLDEPLAATLSVVAADLAGAALMVPKAYREPYSETLVTWALASLSGALACGAVGALDRSLLLFPAYFCLVNGALALLLWTRRARLAQV